MSPPLSAPPIEVVFVMLPGSLVLDWAGPAEALRIANQCLVARGEAERFAMRFVSAEPTSVTSVGVALTGLEPLPAVWRGPAWVVIVGQAGASVSVSHSAARATLHWLRGQRFETGHLELLTICAGTVIAAHAGQLAGRRATPHHRHLGELKAIESRCEVVANRVFVLDPPVFSSAGVTTGVDLMLHRIGETCDAALAAQVAQIMVVALRRGAHDPELSPFLAYRNHLHPAIHRVQDAMGEQPQIAWDVQRMAEVAHTSSRHLARLFQEHAGIAPLKYLRRLRLARAQLALASGDSVARAASASGFSSDVQLRRAWHQFGLPGTPSDAL